MWIHIRDVINTHGINKAAIFLTRGKFEINNLARHTANYKYHPISLSNSLPAIIYINI